MSKNVCELCPKPATMFCESDEARLCWECDHKVHAANFLVANHSRTLLCNVCHSPTPWKASGLNIGPTLSLCRACTRQASDSPETETDDSGEYSTGNQLVPSSDSGATKRRRQNEDEYDCSSSSSRNFDLNFEWDENSNSCSSSPALSAIAVVEKHRRIKRKLY